MTWVAELQPIARYNTPVKHMLMSEPDPHLQPLELAEATDFVVPEDQRPRMPEPLPVRLVAVADVHLPAQAELEKQHDDFYCGLLKMVRDEPREQRIYRADNHRVVFELGEGLIQRDSCRPLGVEIDSLAQFEAGLVEREIEYERLRGIVPGVESIFVMDPSGNWVEVMEIRPV
ncbi:MAG: VOC family protein [Tepidisphaeraceae bacterium]